MQPSFEQYAAHAAQVPPEKDASIRFGDAIRFAFRAERPWMNVLMVVLFSYIPLVGAVALEGWHCEIAQRLTRRHPKPIPTIDFSDFVFYLQRGVQPFLVKVVISLPLSMAIVILIFVGMAGAGVAAERGESGVVIGILIVAAAFFVLMAPLMSIVSTAVYTRAELVEEFRESMRMGKLWAYIRATWLTALGVNLLFGLLATGLVLVGFAACYVGIFVAALVMQLGSIHLRWQIYERYVARGGEPIPVKAPVVLPSEQP